MRVLVYGDFVTDGYIRVSTSRMCPEASDAPVYDIEKRRTDVIGCAGNTLGNVMMIADHICGDLSIDVWWGGITDQCALTTLLSEKTFTSTNLYSLDPVGIRKDRIIGADGKIICRLDSKRVFSVPPAPIIPSPEFDLVIVSDYGFGSIDADVARKLLGLAKISVVDSKREDLTIFRGATAFKLNHSEYSRQVSLMAQTPDQCVEALCHYCVVSKGDAGCEVRVLRPKGREYRIDSVSIPAFGADEVDVTGCGDTFTAAFGLSLLMGREVFDAARAANYLASKVVTKFGPAVPLREELDEARERGLL